MAAEYTNLEAGVIEWCEVYEFRRLEEVTVIVQVILVLNKVGWDLDHC